MKTTNHDDSLCGKSANTGLWYTKPAAVFNDGLPVGTGRLAAMVFGGVRRERLALNHERLWRGNHRRRVSPDAARQLAEVRRLLAAERWEEAARLANDAFGGAGIPAAGSTCFIATRGPKLRTEDRGKLIP